MKSFKVKYLIWNAIPVLVYFVFILLVSTIGSFGFDGNYTFILWILFEILLPVYIVIINGCWMTTKNSVYSFIKFLWVTMMVLCLNYLLKFVIDWLMHISIEVLNGNLKNSFSLNQMSIGIKNFFLKIQILELILCSFITFSVKTQKYS